MLLRAALADQRRPGATAFHADDPIEKDQRATPRHGQPEVASILLKGLFQSLAQIPKHNPLSLVPPEQRNRCRALPRAMKPGADHEPVVARQNKVDEFTQPTYGICGELVVLHGRGERLPSWAVTEHDVADTCSPVAWSVRSWARIRAQLAHQIEQPVISAALALGRRQVAPWVDFVRVTRVRVTPMATPQPRPPIAAGK